MSENPTPEYKATPETPAFDANAYTAPPAADANAYAAPPADPNAYAAPAYAQPGYQVVGEQKSKIAAGLLGIFLGTLGIHNFYLGYTKKAVIQLLISVLSLGFLAVVSSVWGLIEGILILTGSENFRTDAKGVPLRD